MMKQDGREHQQEEQRSTLRSSTVRCSLYVVLCISLEQGLIGIEDWERFAWHGLSIPGNTNEL